MCRQTQNSGRSQVRTLHNKFESGQRGATINRFARAEVGCKLSFLARYLWRALPRPTLIAGTNRNRPAIAPATRGRPVGGARPSRLATCSTCPRLTSIKATVESRAEFIFFAFPFPPPAEKPGHLYGFAGAACNTLNPGIIRAARR